LRAKAEERLAREHNVLRSLIDSIPDPIYVKDLEGRYQRMLGPNGSSTPSG
jgi:PAS domain-containing protein